MRRSFVVLALAVLSAVVSALVSTGPRHVSVTCVCASFAVLPAPGARDVPRNAKIWIVGGVPGSAQLDGGDRVWTGYGKMVAADDARATQQFDPGPLAPGRPYRFRGLDFGPGTRFTTGSSEDTAPPVLPAVRALWIAVRDHGAGPPVAELGLDAALDPDATLLHFVLTGERTRLSFVTTTASWRDLGRPACSTALPFEAGERVRVSISAIDLAGNESVAAIRDIEVGRTGSTLAGCVRRERDDCPTMRPFMVFGGTALTLIGVLGALGCLAMHLRRVREARFAIAEPVSLLVVERLARAVQRRGGVVAAIGIVGVPALVVMHIGPAAIVSTIVGCVGLRAFFIARGALQLIERAAATACEGEPAATRAPATAEVLGHTVIVRRGDEETRLDVSPRALEAARRHAVPMSIATRR